MKTYITLIALGNYIDIKELTVGEVNIPQFKHHGVR